VQRVPSSSTLWQKSHLLKRPLLWIGVIGLPKALHYTPRHLTVQTKNFYCRLWPRQGRINDWNSPASKRISDSVNFGAVIWQCYHVAAFYASVFTWYPWENRRFAGQWLVKVQQLGPRVHRPTRLKSLRGIGGTFSDSRWRENHLCWHAHSGWCLFCLIFYLKCVIKLNKT